MKLLKLISKDVRELASLCATTRAFTSYGLTRKGAEKVFKRALKDSESEIWVVKNSERELVGFAWIMKRHAMGRSPYLRMIVVSPSIKNKGIGSFLMREMEKKFLSSKGMFLLVNSKNKSAQKFYKKHRFKKVGKLTDFLKPGFTEFIFYKPS